MKFAFFESYYQSLRELSPDDAYKVLCAICEYAFNGVDCVDKDGNPLTGVPKAVYSAMRPNVEKSLELSRVRSLAGVKGGAPKGNTNASKEKQANTSKHKQRQSKGKANTSGEGVGEGVGVGVGEGVGNNTPAPLEVAIGYFVEHRKKLKKPMTDHAIDLLRAKLDELAKTDEEKIELINHAISKGWQSVYPIDKPFQKKTSYPQRSYDFSDLESRLIKN